MKRIGLVLLTVTLAAGICTAQGVPKPFDLYLGGGLSFGSAPQEFTDFHKEGYHLAAAIGFNAMPLLQVVGRVEYHSFSKDLDEFMPDVDDLTGGTRRLLMFGVEGRLKAGIPTAPIRPYLLGGIGLARLSESDFKTAAFIILDEYEDETDFFFHAGGGLEFKAMVMFNLFVEGRYVNIKQTGDNLVFIPISVGLKF
ncbi:MAG: outer membrane beta-barrel protein [Candidatus Zixiibacteriota bacterium]|nr:MAG: outer membrane beta-barrel protein [candidate division Zixibacteria bacterium]